MKKIILLTLVPLFLGLCACSENKDNNRFKGSFDKNINKNVSFNKNKKSKRKGKTHVKKSLPRIKDITDIRTVNLGSDDENIMLEWKAPQIKGIPGNFEIFRKVSDNDYENIARTKFYDGRDKILFRWEEHNREYGKYIASNYEYEKKYPLKKQIFKIKFKPLNTSKYQESQLSKEVDAYLVPNSTETAITDIIENLKHAYADDCGFFADFEDDKAAIERNGLAGGKYTREINNDSVIYRFFNYSHMGAIMITGELKSQIETHTEYNQKIFKPVKISGKLNIDGIYKAKLQMENLQFSDKCANTPQNGHIYLKYLHPVHGEMKAGFMGLMIPKDFLYSTEEQI